MNVLLQEPSTGRFLRQDRTWSKERNAAQCFGSATDAVQAAVEHCNVRTQLVYDFSSDFGTEKYNLAFPIKVSSMGYCCPLGFRCRQCPDAGVCALAGGLREGVPPSPENVEHAHAFPC
jgi:hypothetical protein